MVQILAIVLMVGAIVYFGYNVAENLARQGIASGFGFLTKPTGWDVGEALIRHSSDEPYWKTLLVGFLNTLYVSGVAIFFITFLGVFIGACRLSKNLLVSELTSAFVEVFRNVPTILQVIFWSTMMRQLPHAREAVVFLDGIMFSNRGMNFPLVHPDPSVVWGGLSFAVGVVLFFLMMWLSERYRDKTGNPIPTLIPNVVVLVMIPLGVWAALGAQFSLDMPKQARFGISGGGEISPEFVGIVAGLTLHYAAQAGEIVRSGIESVSQGQVEAARALGIRERRIFRKIILPQALRVIIPPMSTEYMSTIRNSSLAVAIGYPELFSLGSTAINQTGQAVEMVLIMLIVYLGTCLFVSVVMNFLNKLAAFR